MSRPFKLPDLGEGIHEAEVVAILVKEGDQIEEGQPFMEVETDKARVEIPSPVTGTIQEVRVKEDETVRVGTVLVVFGDGASSPEAPRTEEQAAANASPQAPPSASERAPRVAGPEDAAQAAASAGAGGRANGGPVPASPATRRLARELGVDLRSVTASGPAGLVTAEDVRSFAARALEKKQSPGKVETAGPESQPQVPNEAPTQEFPGTLGIEAAPVPDFARWGSVERLPLKSVRRATAKHMAVAWSQIPHVNHQDVADITNLDAYRHAQKADVEAGGGQLTNMIFVMKAVVAALKAFPRFNCSVDMKSEEIILKRYFHLGVAVDTDRGLVVPVIRDVDRKSILELSLELKNVAERARAGETSIEEMQGGTFTITNIGALGGTSFAPIVNYPEVAILGMGRAKLQPVVLGDLEDYQIVPRLQMPLVLAFDHRVADGADAARFMRMVIEALEDPSKLWLRM